MNQNAEQIARDKIDRQLTCCGWAVQKKSEINLFTGVGVAVRDYITDVGPADYILFVDRNLLVSSKKNVRRRVSSSQRMKSSLPNMRTANSSLSKPNHFCLYTESIAELTLFTDYRNSKPRSRHIFTFHRPKTFRE